VRMESRGRVGGVVVGALVVGVLIGIVLGFIFDKGAQESPQAQPPTATGPGPTAEENGVPVGYSRTEEGAVAAATNFNLLAGRDELLDLDAMTTAMQTLAAPSWKDEAGRQAESGYEYIVDTYGDDADVSAAVVRYDLVNFTTDRASVRLWTVSLASGSRRPNVEEVWAIVTVDLIWVDDDWRVEDLESSVGPAPVDLPSGQPAENATTLMEEFDEFEGAPVP
jgi:hypothetical protein